MAGEELREPPADENGQYFLFSPVLLAAGKYMPRPNARPEAIALGTNGERGAVATDLIVPSAVGGLAVGIELEPSSE